MLNLKTYLVVFFFITAVSASWFRQLENTSNSGDSRRSSSSTTTGTRRRKKKTKTTQQRSQRRQASTRLQQQQEEDRWTEFERQGFYSFNAADDPLPLTTTTDSRRRKQRSVVVEDQQQQDQSITTTILNKLQNKISTILLRGFHTYDHLAFQQIKQIDFDQIKTTAGGNGNNIPCHSLDSIDATIDLYSSHISGLDTFVVVANEEEETTTTSWDLLVQPTSTTTASSSSHLHHVHPHHSNSKKNNNKKKKKNHEDDWKATLAITGSFHKIWARLGADVWTNCPELQNTTMTDIKVYLQEPGITLEITVEGTWSQSQSQLPSSSSSLIINKVSIENLELTFSSFQTSSYTMDSLDSSGEAIAKSSSSSSSFTTTSSSSTWWAKNLLTRTIEGFVLDGLQTNIEPEIQSGLNIDLGSEFPTTTSMDRGDSSIIISS